MSHITVFGQHKPLTSAETRAFKDEVAKRANDLETLESSFTQTKHLDFVDKAVKSSGKLYFRSPQLIRWEYTTPFSYYVIFDRDKMHINDNGNEKNVDVSASKVLRDVSQMLIGTVQGTTIFDETKFDIAYHKKDGGYLTTFKPKDKTLAKYINQIELNFDGSSYLVQHIKITEPSMDYTEITFSNQKKNTPISDEKFAVQ